MKFSLSALLLAGIATASPVVTSSKWKRAALNDMDFQIVNLARNLESLELALWNQGLNNFTDAQFASANYTGFRNYIKLFRDQEIAHFTVLKWVSRFSFDNALIADCNRQRRCWW